jgi:hypothetical protein
VWEGLLFYFYYSRTGVGGPVIFIVLRQVLEGLYFIILEQVLEGLLNLNFILLRIWRIDLFVSWSILCIRVVVPVQ